MILQSLGHSVCGGVQKKMTINERLRQSLLENKKKPALKKRRIKTIVSRYRLHAKKGETGDQYEKDCE